MMFTDLDPTFPTITDDQVEFFKAECLKAAERFGLQDWCFYFQSIDEDGYFGEAGWTANTRSATISLNRKWPTTPTEETLKRTAVHEMAHILLASLVDAAKDRFANEKQISEAAEAVVVTIENLLCSD